MNCFTSEGPPGSDFLRCAEPHLMGSSADLRIGTGKGSMDRWIIQPNVIGGWDVKAQKSAGPSFRTSTRKEAEDWAQTASNPW